MSTIGSSDGPSREGEVTRRNREDYKQKESELVKKHQKEITRLTEQYSRKIEELKKSHESQMNSLKHASSESISARDHKYQKEIENLRALHRKTVQETVGNANRNLETNRKVASDELKGAEERGDERLRSQAENFERTIREREENLSNELDNMRQEQQDAIKTYHEKVNATHEEEMEKVSDTYQKQLAETKAQDRRYRKNATSQLRNMELHHMEEKKKASETLQDTVNSERQNQSANEKHLRQGFRDGLMKARERYADYLEKERDATQMISGQLESSVNHRVANEMSHLERQIQELKASNVRDEVGRKHASEREIANIRDSYQDNVKIAERQRDEAVRTGNEERSKDIANLQKDHSQKLVDVNREYLERINRQEQIHRTAFDQIKSDFLAHNAQNKNTADLRVRHVYEELEAEKTRLQENRDEARKIMDRSHKEELGLVRENAAREKLTTVEQLKEFMRKQEIEHAQKNSVLTSKFEKEISRLNDELMKQKRSHDEEMKRVVSQLQRQQKAELDTQQLQYQEKLRKVQDQHSDELRVTNQRNQERMDYLISVTKKT